MHPEMSQLTRNEVLAKLQNHSVRTGMEYITKLINQAVELFGWNEERCAAGTLNSKWFDELKP